MHLRRVAATLAALPLLLAPLAPAAAHDDSGEADPRLAPDRVAGLAGLNGSSLPLVTSDNVAFESNFPDTLGISGCFSKTAPYFYMSSLDSISVFDTSNPLKPRLSGMLDNIVFENEAMTCGERKGKKGTAERFVLVGNNLYDYSSSDPEGSAGSTLKNELIVVDVTDPAKPFIRSRLTTTTGDHTVACIKETSCDYAYSSGGRGQFSVVDLRDLDNPVEVDSDPSAAGTQPFASPTAGHKWNFDDAGLGIHTGKGSGVFDVSDPRDPQLVTTTGRAGEGFNDDGTRNGYNDFIHHNSFRPNAEKFVADAPPSVENGNVLLVTEEDYEDVDCSTAGSFQAWHVRRLDGTPSAIVPLDKVELSDLGTFPLPVGAFCSSHWFDYHPSGIVSVGFYGGGVQLIDVRDATDLTSYGSAVWGASEVWDSYWVPVYNKAGTATGKRTNIIYSVDLVRGLDVYSVDLPKTKSSGDNGLLTDTLVLSSAEPPHLGSTTGTTSLLLAGALALLAASLLLPRMRTARVRTTTRKEN